MFSLIRIAFALSGTASRPLANDIGIGDGPYR